MARLDDIRWERERRRCRGDGTVEGDLAAFEHFCASYVTIRHPNGRRKLVLREAQRETVRAFLANDRTLVLKARQIGFTTVVMAFCLWQVLFHDDCRIIVLNRREKDAIKNLGMVMFAWDQLPKQLLKLLPRRLNNHQQEFKVSNGSEILCYPSNNNPARGDTGTWLILDEWAFMPNPEEAWASIEPAADIGGRIIALSTANGIGNLFHQMWVDSENGKNSFRRVFFSWRAVPERDDRWYENQKLSKPEWTLHQEFPTDPESAFIKSGNAVFPMEMLAKFSKNRKAPRGYLSSEDDRLNRSKFEVGADGPVTMFEEPRPECMYVVGADIALGLEHGDYSSAHVLRAGREPAVVATWHGHIDPDLFGEELMRLGYLYNTAMLGIEANNMGQATIAAVRRMAYPWVYRRRTLNRRIDADQEQMGWLTTAANKGYLISDLNATLREDGLYLECPRTLSELRSYVREPDGKMHGSPHDDRVMSLAIGVQMLTFAASPEQAPPTGAPIGSFQWHFDRMMQGKRPKVEAIGTHNVRHAIAV